MKSLDSIKRDLIEKIEAKQALLMKYNITSKDHTVTLNELELLKLELKETSNLNGNTFVRKTQEYKKVKNKYSFLQGLTMDQILYLLENIRFSSKRINEAYENGIEFSDLLTDLKNEILINNVDYTKINSSETIEKILDILKQKYDLFKNNVEEFYMVTRNFNSSKYEMLGYAINYKEPLSINTLLSLKGLGQDNLIDAILEKYNQIKQIKREPFLTSKTKQERKEEINIKINEYLKSLYKCIGLFIKQNYKEYKDKIGLNIDEFKEENIIELYKNILEQIAQKNTEIKKLIQRYGFLLTTYLSFESHIKKNLKNIDIDVNKLKEDGIDLFALNKEDIFEILSQLNLYEALTEEKKKEESSILLLKAAEQDD